MVIQRGGVSGSVWNFKVEEQAFGVRWRCIAVTFRGNSHYKAVVETHNGGEFYDGMVGHGVMFQCGGITEQLLNRHSSDVGEGAVYSSTLIYVQEAAASDYRTLHALHEALTSSSGGVRESALQVWSGEFDFEQGNNCIGEIVPGRSVRADMRLLGYDNEGFRDFCVVCGDGGDLALCKNDYYTAECGRAYHAQCVPAEFKQPGAEEDWPCPVCQVAALTLGDTAAHEPRLTSTERDR